MFLINIRLKQRVIKSLSMLGFISNCYKDQKTCDKAVSNYSHAFRFLPDFYMTQLP